MMWSGHSCIKRWSPISLSLNLGRLVQLTPCFLQVLLGALNHHIRILTFPRPPCREDVKPRREATSGQLNYSLSPGFTQAWAPHTWKSEAAADSRPQATTWASLRVIPWGARQRGADSRLRCTLTATLTHRLREWDERHAPVSKLRRNWYTTGTGNLSVYKTQLYLYKPSIKILRNLQRKLYYLKDYLKKKKKTYLEINLRKIRKAHTLKSTKCLWG